MVLNISLLGQVEMERDGQHIAGSSLGRLGRVALAYLITERHRPVPHPELADVLWGEDLPQSWQQLVRGTAGKLRTALRDLGFEPTEILTTRFGCYQFNLPPGASVDVDTASAAVEAAVAALAVGDADGAQAEATTAAALTSRQFVPGGFGLWIDRRQAELHELHLHALEVLADAATLGRRFDRAILAADTAISLEPFRESSYHRLIAAHAAGNHRGEALQAHDRCRVALAEHLGVAPSPETEALYLGLLDTEPVSTSPAPPVTDERAPLPPSLELLAGGLLVGRADEQDALYRAFRRTGSEGRQAVFVAGEPGAGKRRLSPIWPAGFTPREGSCCMADATRTWVLLFNRLPRRWAATTVPRPWPPHMGRQWAPTPGPCSEIPLPWTRMRQVYALLGLVKKWGPKRVDAACARALEAEAISDRAHPGAGHAETHSSRRRRHLRHPVVASPGRPSICLRRSETSALRCHRESGRGLHGL